jgi:nitrogen fixation-related uncharacterized protein
MPESLRSARRRRLALLIMAAAILLPSQYGFGTKFVEFIALYRGDVEGAFAITPILNYLLASLGFLCLFAWAIMSGMFHDIEGPKWTMLENEALLDRSLAEPPNAEFGGRLSGAMPQATGNRATPNRFGGFYERD